MRFEYCLFAEVFELPEYFRLPIMRGRISERRIYMSTHRYEVVSLYCVKLVTNYIYKEVIVMREFDYNLL